MTILKVEPSAINTQAEFSFGNLTVSGNIEVGSTVIATTETGDIAFNTSTGTVEFNSNTVSFLANVAITGPAGAIGYTGSRGDIGYTGSVGIGGGDSAVPKITNIQVTDSSYTVLDDTAVALTGGYIKITGTGFVSGCQVLVNNTPATSVTFVSTTEVRAQLPATSAGTYVVYLVNADGGVAIRVNGVTFSSSPTWVTGSDLGIRSAGASISIQLNVTGDSPLTYVLQAGSSLPLGLSLSSAGLLSGAVTGITSNTIYNFTVIVTDPQLQESVRALSITLTVAEELFVPAGTTLLLGLKFNNSSLTQSGTLTTSLNQTLTYVTSGGISDSGYATGWNINQGIRITGFSTASSCLNKTYVAWYKGTQTNTNTGGNYSPSVPIIGETSNSVFFGLGLSAGKITVANGSQNLGTSNVATNQWVCLAWTVSSGTVVNGFVNGVKEITNISCSTGAGINYIGAGFAYTGAAAPSALDAVQIFDGILSDAQIAEIYSRGAS